MTVAERPILFSDPMVRAILAGTKTQTRRVVKGEALTWLSPHVGFTPEFVASKENGLCPYGQPGDRLYVKERHAFLDVTKSALSQFPLEGGGFGPDVWNLCVEYSDGTENDAISVEGAKPKQTRERGETRWRPSIHMPRWASRITLEITGIRVERLWEISLADVQAEGCPFRPKTSEAEGWYRQLWEQINGPGSWDANPWVWVVEFRRVGHA